MLKVGLTGSIAVGKSFVVDVFRELGCHVLDANRRHVRLLSLEPLGLPGSKRVLERKLFCPPANLTAANSVL